MSSDSTCRICCAESTDLSPISEEVRDNFYSLTSVHLIKSDTHSNSVCKSCSEKLSSTRIYVNTLTENELRLLSHTKDDPVTLDSVVFVESESIALLPEIKIEENEVEDNLKDESDSPSEPRVRKRKRLIPANFICDLCGKNFHRKSSIISHMHVHLNVQPYTCPRACGKSFFSRTAMRLHVKFTHANHAPAFICEVCAMSYKQRYLLLEHIAAKHAGVRFRCTYAGCSNEYHSQSALRKHVDSIHESVLVACEFCGERFRTGFSLYQHKRLNHSGRRFPCTHEGCGKSFATGSKLKTHAKIHAGMKDFVCHVCNASYHIKRNLGRHIQVVHKKSRFFCEIGGCSASLCNKDNYRAHMRKVHANLPPDEMDKRLESIAKMKPVFLDDDDEYDQDGVTV